MILILKLLLLVFISFLPLIELRLAIPIGILEGSIALPFGITMSGMGLNPILVFLLCVIADIILGIILYHILNFIDKLLHKIKWLEKYYAKQKKKSRRKMKYYIKKYGVWGVALFIAIPLPGSGVYTGTLGAYLIGLDKKQFYKALIVGTTLAGIIVTFLTLGGMALFDVLI